MSTEGYKAKNLDEVIRQEEQFKRRRDRLMRMEPLIDIDLLATVTSAQWSGRVQLYELRCKHTPGQDNEWLFIVKGFDEEGAPVIGFHSDGSLLNGLATLARRLSQGNIKWREDEYYRGANTGGGD